MKKNSNFLILIPAYNEENNIIEVVELSKKYADVCVINDSSSDSTLKKLNTCSNIKIINHKINTHIPGAIIDGMKYAYEQNYDYVITMDAGFSHNPNEIPRFIDYMDCDLLIGIRSIISNKPSVYRILLSKIGNFLYNVSLDFPSSIIFFSKYKDLTSGFRRFSKKSIKIILEKKIHSKSYDFHLETVFYIYKKKKHIYETPISYQYTNSSLNNKVVLDCIVLWLKAIFGFIKSKN